MSKTPVVIAFTAVLLAGSVWAQETDQAKEIVAPQWAAERFERQAKMDELMGTLTEEMAAIRETKDRTKRKALMATHRDHIREAMGLMRGMGGKRIHELMAEHMGPDIDPKMKSVRPQHKHKGIASPRPRAEMSDAQRLADLEDRIDMMQVMMESLMDGYTQQ